jgi:hypothetical protein
MDDIRPKGEPVPPTDRDPRLKDTMFGESFVSVEARASHAAMILLHNLTASQKPPDISPEVPDQVKARLESTSYALQDAWIGLNKGKSK